MKKYLVTGLAVVLPAVLTLMIAIFVIDFMTKPFIPIVRFLLPFSLPPEAIVFLSRAIALVLLCVLILVLGVIARHFLFKNAAQLANYILLKIPFVRTVYKVSRDLFSAIFAPEGQQAFKRGVMIPFPSPPHSLLGFAAGEAPAECVEKVGHPLVSVFAPTAPHPISGFLFLLPLEEVKKLDMTKEDLVKYLVSGGVILPENDKKQ